MDFTKFLLFSAILWSGYAHAQNEVYFGWYREAASTSVNTVDSAAAEAQLKQAEEAVISRLRIQRNAHLQQAKVFSLERLRTKIREPHADVPKNRWIPQNVTTAVEGSLEAFDLSMVKSRATSHKLDHLVLDPQPGGHSKLRVEVHAGEFYVTEAGLELNQDARERLSRAVENIPRSKLTLELSLREYRGENPSFTLSNEQSLRLLEPVNCELALAGGALRVQIKSRDHLRHLYEVSPSFREWIAQIDILVADAMTPAYVERALALVLEIASYSDMAKPDPGLANLSAILAVQSPLTPQAEHILLTTLNYWQERVQNSRANNLEQFFSGRATASEIQTLNDLAILQSDLRTFTYTFDEN